MSRIICIIIFSISLNAISNTFCYKLLDKLNARSFLKKIVAKITNHKFTYGMSKIKDLEILSPYIFRLEVMHILSDLSYSENYYFLSKFNYNIMNDLKTFAFINPIYFDLISKFNKTFNLIAVQKHLGTITLISDYYEDNTNILLRLTPHEYSLHIMTNNTENYLPCSHGLIIPFYFNEYGLIQMKSKKGKELSTMELLSYLPSDLANSYIYVTNNKYLN